MATLRFAIASLTAFVLLSPQCLAKRADATKAELNRIFVLAIERDDSAKALSLLERGADPNARDRNGYSALMHAARNENLALVRALIDRGASIGYRTRQGDTVLVEAAKRYRQKVELIALLIERGAK